ncbi:MAG TPA: hypothetical protein VNI54_18185 [Thermoanaerobaculia bacterium]|nr:hypothetical protein [Thermoanaerobaculia bacterium]
MTDDYIGLFVTQWQGRRAVWKSVPSSGQVRPQSRSLSMQVDAWAIDELEIRRQSDHVAVCSACNGEGKVSCATCGANGKVLCMECNGARKMYGYASNGARRLLNCTRCRGKGEVDCATCRRGIAVCATCNGERRVQRWIEVERWSRADAGAHPAALARHYGLTGLSANRAIEPVGAVIKEIERPHGIEAADAPGVPRQWLEILPRPQPGERVVQQKLRVVRIPRLTVSYTLGRARGEVEFSGLNLRPPAPGTSDIFAARRSTLRNLAGLLVLIFITAAIFVVARGPFYWSLPSALALATILITFVCIWFAVANATGARRHVVGWSAGAFAALLLAALFTWIGRPTEEHAAQAIAAGSLDAAAQELAALGAGEDDPIWADLHLARITQTSDLGAIRRELARIPRHLPQHAAAVRTYLPRVRDAAVREAERARALTTARERLNARLAAERLWMEWELASGRSGTPELIAVRTEMAHDLTILEKEQR